jgi:hypothetical protein
VVIMAIVYRRKDLRRLYAKITVSDTVDAS